jgi:helicase required for RNAi-mediated heterochromatin assembly 1
MILGFIDYLTLNGEDASKITILTFYNGQRKCVLRVLRQHQNFSAMSGLKVVTVDGYQGTQRLSVKHFAKEMFTNCFQARKTTLSS